MTSKLDAGRINILLDWCSANSIDIDPKLHVVPDDTGLAVYSGEDFIPPSQTLGKISKIAVLSVKSSSLSQHIEQSPYGFEAQLALSFALLVELYKGVDSRWFGYLQSLPDTVGLPIFWSTEVDAETSNDGQTALGWLKGTEVEKLLLGRDGVPLLNDISRYFNEVVVPTMNGFTDPDPEAKLRKPNLQDFFRAYSLVSSRAFLVDAYHGLAMVPIADAFNHTSDHHVHLETEYAVCPECGSLQQCPHDRDVDTTMNPQPSGGTDPPHTDTDDSYDMVSNTVIPPHSEVFNTYGEALSNAQLLCQYGFALDVNENDHISWKHDDLISFLHSLPKSKLIPEDTTRVRNPDVCEPLGLPWDALTGSFDKDVFADSELVFDPSPPDIFCINCEGKVSWQLWLLVASYHCARLVAANEVPAFLAQLSRYQVQQEDQSDDVDEDMDETITGPVARGIASSICALCQHRKARIGSDESIDQQDLGELIDTLPKSMRRTRLALSQVFTELSMLNSCEAAWSEMNSVD